MAVVQKQRGDPEALPRPTVRQPRVCGAAAPRLTLRGTERHIHAARRVVVLRARLFRAAAHQLELSGVVKDASALGAVVGTWLDVWRGSDQLIATIANHTPQRAFQADGLAQMSRCRSLATVRASRTEFLDGQDSRTPACDLTCHITRALQPAPVVIDSCRSNIESSNTQREGTRLLADAECLSGTQSARLGVFSPLEACRAGLGLA